MGILAGCNFAVFTTDVNQHKLQSIMKTINKTLLRQISIIALIAITFNSCEKDNENRINNTNDKTTAVFNPNLTYGTMTDQDGNIYKTIHINGQTWMAENLRTTKYRNGDAIPQITDNTTWASLTTGAFCNYKNTENIDTIASYGRLYNWFSISDSRKLAPLGWHVATNTDWHLLINLLNGDGIAGTKLKEISNLHWYRTNKNATNESGLTILPSGLRDPSIGNFCCMGSKGILWSSTQADDSYAWIISVDNYSNNCNRISNHMKYGYAIRCVKD